MQHFIGRDRKVLHCDVLHTLKSIPPTKILDGIIVPNFGAAVVVCVVIGWVACVGDAHAIIGTVWINQLELRILVSSENFTSGLDYYKTTRIM